MRDVNADVDRALASGSARMEAITREMRARSRECQDAVASTARGNGNGNDDARDEATMEHDRKAAIKLVNDRVSKLSALADERVRIANAMYDFVDEHITRLDKDLAAFERDVSAKPQGKWKGDRDEVEDGETMRNGVGGGDGGGTTYDEQIANPNEPTYCLCQRVSFGQMVRCDNDDCAIAWFHFQCVGLSANPKGKWLCPTCRRRDGSKR